MEDQSSNSRESAAFDATQDFSTNQSFPTVDANRLLEAYHNPWEDLPSQTKYPDRFRSYNRHAQTPYSSTQTQSSSSNWSVQNFNSNLLHTTPYGNSPAQNISATFPDINSFRYWPVQIVGANFSDNTSHDYLPTENAGANFSDITSHQNWPVQTVSADLHNTNYSPANWLVQTSNAELLQTTPHDNYTSGNPHLYLPIQTVDDNWSHHSLHNNPPSQTLQSSCPSPSAQTEQAPQYNWPIQAPHSNWCVQPAPSNPIEAHTVFNATLPSNGSYARRTAQLPNSNCPEQTLDRNLPFQRLDAILPTDLRDVYQPNKTVVSNSPEQTPTARPIQTVNAGTGVQTVGANVGGNVTAQNVTFNANAPSSLASQTSRKSTFRLNIPTPTKHYKGRQDTLGKLQEFFNQLPQKSRDCWERIVAIVGLGGMGKTETACKYAAQNRDAFPNAAWINAETEQGMLKSFFDLAKYLKIVDKEQKSADLNLVKEVYRYIDQEYDSNALFIFDNAIGLNLDGAEVGILDFLPTDDLPNQRFPNILITTQTPDWDKQIKTLQVEGLTEKEAQEFYGSCFKIKPSECTEELKKFSDLLQGYPLCMNLAVSSIDFVPGKHSVRHLKQQIKKYIDKVKKEEERLTSEKIKPAWGHKYNRTLSTVWKLTQERIQKEEDGPEVLEILQIMSFLHLPVPSSYLVYILQSNTDCPHLEDKDIQFRLKNLFRVLEKLYLARILDDDSEDQGTDDEISGYGYECDVGIHRLVQLVVRQQTNCIHALETLLRVVEIYDVDGKIVNLSVLEEALENPRIQLTSRSLPYIAALALRGNRTAHNFFETRTPETETDTIYWRLCSLMTKSSDLIAHQVNGELVGLTKSSERLVDRQCFASITLDVAYKDSEKGPLYDKCVYRHSLNSHLHSMDDMEDLTVELILNICSFQDSTCERRCNSSLELQVIKLIEYLVKGFLQVDGLKPKSVPVERLAATWLAFLAKHNDYRSHGKSLLRMFWATISDTFHSLDASPLRIAELRKCLWGRGLADELIQAIKSIKPSSFWNYLAFPECFDVCLDGLHLLDVRCQQVISAFTEMTTKCYLETLNSNSEIRMQIICDVCLVWIKLLLKDGDPTSESILDCLSQCKALNWFDGKREDSIPDIKGHFKTVNLRRQTSTGDIVRYIIQGYIEDEYAIRRLPLYWKYELECFSEFIRRYSSSQIGPIQALRTFCEIALGRPTRESD